MPPDRVQARCLPCSDEFLRETDPGFPWNMPVCRFSLLISFVLHRTHVGNLQRAGRGHSSWRRTGRGASAQDGIFTPWQSASCASVTRRPQGFRSRSGNPLRRPSPLFSFSAWPVMQRNLGCDCDTVGSIAALAVLWPAVVTDLIERGRPPNSDHGPSARNRGLNRVSGISRVWPKAGGGDAREWISMAPVNTHLVLLRCGCVFQ